MSRRLQSLMLIAVICSNLLISVHVSAHLATNTVECELCAAYSDSPKAIPVIDSSLPVAAQAGISPLSSTTFLQRASIDRAHQRGPPSHSI